MNMVPLFENYRERAMLDQAQDSSSWPTMLTRDGLEYRLVSVFEAGYWWLSINVNNKAGMVVGMLELDNQYNPGEGYMQVSMSEVDSDNRRQGIATTLYVVALNNLPSGIHGIASDNRNREPELAGMYRKFNAYDDGSHTRIDLDKMPQKYKL